MTAHVVKGFTFWALADEDRCENKEVPLGSINDHSVRSPDYRQPMDAVFHLASKLGQQERSGDFPRAETACIRAKLPAKEGRGVDGSRRALSIRGAG